MPLNTTFLNDPRGIDPLDKPRFIQDVWAPVGLPPSLPGCYFAALLEQLHPNIFNPAHHQAQTYQQLVTVIHTIQRNRRMSRNALIDQVANDLGVRPPAIVNRQAVEMSIDLATFAWTMLQFQTLPSLAGRPPPLRWNNNLSFNTVLNKYFPGGEHSEAYDIKVNEVTRLLTPPHQPNFAGTLEKRPEPYSDRRFSDLFTFLDMDRLSGFRITPTDNLCDHLRIEKHSGRSFDIRLYVFYQANFLEMLRHATLPGAHILISKETWQTLGLLIPQDRECHDWFLGRVNQSDGTIDRRAGNITENGTPISRRVNDYHYWRTRLLELEREFEDAAPKGLWRTYLDRRKRRERSNFCIGFWAVVIAVIALLLSAITGILLSKQAYVANDFARDSSISADLAAASAANQSSSCAVAGFGYCPVACCSTFFLRNSTTLSTASTEGNSTTTASQTSTGVTLFTYTVIVTSTITVYYTETFSQ